MCLKCNSTREFEKQGMQNVLHRFVFVNRIKIWCQMHNCQINRINIKSSLSLSLIIINRSRSVCASADLSDSSPSESMLSDLTLKRWWSPALVENLCCIVYSTGCDERFKATARVNNCCRSQHQNRTQFHILACLQLRPHRQAAGILRAPINTPRCQELTKYSRCLPVMPEQNFCQSEDLKKQSFLSKNGDFIRFLFESEQMTQLKHQIQAAPHYHIRRRLQISNTTHITPHLTQRQTWAARENFVKEARGPHQPFGITDYF